MSARENRVKVIAAVVVMMLFIVSLTLLMPALSRSRLTRATTPARPYDKTAERTAVEEERLSALTRKAEAHVPPLTTVPKAAIKSFDADIELTPKLSVGTATPESIYVLDFKAEIQVEPEPGNAQSEILLPVPPEIVSLSDLEFKVNGERSEDFTLRAGYLVLQGRFIENEPSQLEVTYSAVGKGIFVLEKPPGRIVDLFKASLVTHKSDIRMLQLSLQPNDVKHGSNMTTYEWEYPRLLVARPIIIDVLGISAIDMLGELTWTGPIGVAVFAVLYLTIALATRPERYNIWTVMLVVGCFTAGFPLMYFLQEYGSLTVAALLGIAVVTAIVGVRTVTLFGTRVGIIAGVGLPIVIMLLTVGATIADKVSACGTLLTIESIMFLVVFMIYFPKAKENMGYTHVVYQEGKLPTP